jgi:hypothetical protein
MLRLATAEFPRTLCDQFHCLKRLLCSSCGRIRSIQLVLCVPFNVLAASLQVSTAPKPTADPQMTTVLGGAVATEPGGKTKLDS